MSWATKIFTSLRRNSINFDEDRGSSRRNDVAEPHLAKLYGREDMMMLGST